MAGPSDFYNSVYSTARDLGANDVQARLAAAQASEETGYGQHMVGGNLFGIKAGSDYTGSTVNAGTNEEYNGQFTRENANFRAYDDFTSSVKDYLGVIQSNFPDAWNASSFEEAAEGLKNGVFGSYATNSSYANNLEAIDNKYGATSYAQNPENVPTPFAPDDLSNNSLLSAFSPAPQTEDPFSALLGGQPQPAVTGWSDMASAKPVQAPMDSVQASGLLGGVPAQEAAARATPMMSLPATADLGTTPGLDASTTAGILSNASPAERMGIAEPGFDPGRFDGLGAQVASVDASRFSTPAKTDRIGTTETLSDPARMDPLTGAIDPATNTQSLMDQPAAPANIAGFANAYEAQRGPLSGLLSANAQTVQGLAEQQALEASRQVPSLSVPSTGLLAGNAPLEAQATVPSLASSYVAPQAVTPAVQAIDALTTGSTTPGLLSPTQIATANAPLSSSITSSDLTGKGILAGQPVQQNQFVSSFPTAVAQNQIEPASVDGVVAAPTLDTIQVAEQPAVATVDGPANTPAVEQQQQAAVTNATQGAIAKQAAQPSLASRIAKTVNPGTLTGSMLGSLALGPAGGIIGGLLGNKAYQSGGLSGLLGSGFMAPTTQIGGGIANIGGIYGGQYAPGTYSVASNGATITAQPGGYTSYTNKYGVTEAIGPDGKISSVWGGSPSTPSKDTSSNGGYDSPGLF